ncbi:hypothetical protein [Baekduia sp. Peel2402]|uniref:hypothetical protein n=1 Tax=Baekduia sp. Peel2402 TaxID=3458296 RepID=UPI00403EE7D0
MSLRTSSCGECSALLHADQRYCLECGARHGAPRIDALSELGFEPTGDGVAPAVPAAVAVQEPVPVGRATPSRRLTAALAIATLALGGVAGAAVGPVPEGSIAAAPARVVALVVPQAAPATSDDATATEDDAAPPEDEGTSDTPSAADDDASSDDASAASDDSASDDATAEDDTAADDDASDDESPAAADPDSASSTTPSSTDTAGTAPAHVWLVSLPAADAATAFGAASPLAPLVAAGALLPNYAAAGPSSAANQLALLGGQVPTADCVAALTACVLPAGETSLLDQLSSIQLTWRAYVEDPAARCAATPNARVGTSLFTTLSQRGDCATTTVAPDQLATDLATASKTPALSLVVPSTNESAKAIADQVLASEAYKKDGVLVLAPDAPAPVDPAAAPGTVAAPTGALVLSPKATAGSTLDAATGPVALLRSVDVLFGLDPLGAAAQATAGALDPIFPPSNTTNSTRRSP